MKRMHSASKDREFGVITHAANTYSLGPPVSSLFSTTSSTALPRRKAHIQRALDRVWDAM